MMGGWTAFEEEFDRIVPRDRPDYGDIKRDLLVILQRPDHATCRRALGWRECAL
jgi:hypothetical protein